MYLNQVTKYNILNGYKSKSHADGLAFDRYEPYILLFNQFLTVMNNFEVEKIRFAKLLRTG